MKNLVVIFGGASVEHDVSIITGLQAVEKLAGEYNLFPVYLSVENDFYLTNFKKPKDFLDKEKIKKESKQISFCKNGFLRCKGKKFKKFVPVDFVLNCCHGGVGEKGDLFSFFLMNDIITSSSDSLSANISMDKYLTKLVLEKEGVAVTKGCLINRDNMEEKIKTIKKDFSHNLIVKPNSLGSSVGVIKSNFKDLKSNIEKVLCFATSALVEECVENLEEFNCAVVKNKDELLLSLVEKVGGNDFLSYEDKYYEGKSLREIPAKIDEELQKEIYDTTKKVYNLLNMSGIARIDYLFDKKEKKLYFNEINSIPGSLAFYLFEGLGIDYSMLVDIALENIKMPQKQIYFESDILTKTAFKNK